MPASTLTQKLSDDAQALTPKLEALYDRYKHLEGENVMVMFSGGLDTSFITHFLTHVIGANVTTFHADVGSVTEPASSSEVEARAKEVGAVTHIVIDGKEKLAELGLQAVAAEATIGGGHGHHPASSLSRVVMSDLAVEYAKTHKISAVFHGSNGSQNNPFRIKAALNHFQKVHQCEIEECTPNVGDTTVDRETQVAYLKAAGVSIKTQKFESTVSHDRNLLGDEWEEGRLADPAFPFDIRKAAGLKDVPLQPASVTIRFEAGRPVALKIGKNPIQDMSPTEIFEKLNLVGKDYHIGISDYPETRPIGIVAREVHIAPAMEMLVKAHNWLRAYKHPDMRHELSLLSQHWAHTVMEENNWTGRERQAMDAVFKKFDTNLTGEVSFTLEHGAIRGMTSYEARGRLEGSTPPATPEFIEQYVSGRAPKPELLGSERELRREISSLLADLSSGRRL